MVSRIRLRANPRGEETFFGKNFLSIALLEPLRLIRIHQSPGGQHSFRVKPNLGLRLALVSVGERTRNGMLLHDCV